MTAVVAVCLASAGTFALRGWMGTSVSILFFPAVIVVAMHGGHGPALFATLLSTLSLAYLFIPPYYSFDIGPDDVIRLTVFAVVAVVTASLSSSQRQAEAAQREALDKSGRALNTLRKVSGWPVFADVSLAGGVSKLLAHAASVVGSECAVVVWEAEDEPWVYMAEFEMVRMQPDGTGVPGAVGRHPPSDFAPVVPPDLQTATFVSEAPIEEGTAVTVSEGSVLSSWTGQPVHRDIASRLRGNGVASAPFHLEHLSGRVFFSGLDAAHDVIPLVDILAREVGNSLEQLHLHDRLQQIAIREDRIRVARDLHDGVLQSLTGIRFQLQAIAGESDAPSTVSDRLLAVERAIAIEQRELRMFIEDLKPVARPVPIEGEVAHALEELRARLAAEWKTPITVRVNPVDLSLPTATERTLGLILREAIVNALKHAHPSRVSVDVEAQGADRLRAVVTNDGRGFPFRGRLEHDALVALNAGPVSLRERLASAGGSVAIESTATGARVEITLPV